MALAKSEVEDVRLDVGLKVELADVQFPAEEVEVVTTVVALAMTSVFVIVVVQDQSLSVVVMLLASTVVGTRSATSVAAIVVMRIAEEVVQSVGFLLRRVRRTIYEGRR